MRVLGKIYKKKYNIYIYIIICYIFTCRYILPNHMLLKISEMLPKELSGILACCSPIPPMVRQCLHEIHHIIKQARDQTFENVSSFIYNINTILHHIMLFFLLRMKNTILMKKIASHKTLSNIILMLT